MFEIRKYVFRKETFFNLLCCTAALLICLFMWMWYHSANDEMLRVLLWPFAKAVDVFYRLPLHYTAEAGYIAPGGAFAIGRECIGVNFIMLMFSMHVCLFIHRFPGLKKVFWLTFSFAGSVIAGIFFNCLRIIGSVPFVLYDKFSTIHTISGVILYLSALIGSYFLAQKILGVKSHEKPR